MICIEVGSDLRLTWFSMPGRWICSFFPLPRRTSNSSSLSYYFLVASECPASVLWQWQLTIFLAEVRRVRTPCRCGHAIAMRDKPVIIHSLNNSTTRGQSFTIHDRSTKKHISHSIRGARDKVKKNSEQNARKKAGLEVPSSYIYPFTAVMLPSIRAPVYFLEITHSRVSFA